MQHHTAASLPASLKTRGLCSREAVVIWFDLFEAYGLLEIAVLLLCGNFGYIFFSIMVDCVTNVPRSLALC